MDDKKGEKANLIYGVEDNPPFLICIFLALQQAITSFGANVAICTLTCSAMCIEDKQVVGQVLCTVFFVNGISTFIQVTFGIRLPIVQGAAGAFMVPILAILNLPSLKCQHGESNSNALESLADNVSEVRNISWPVRMLEIQGAIIGSAFLEMIFGLTGLVGLLMKIIGPLTLAPAIVLVGLSLFPVAADKAATNWPVSLLTSLTILVFYLYLGRVQMPCWFYSMKSCNSQKIKVFTLFPVLFGIATVWILCILLTVTNAVPNDQNHWAYHIRTDTKVDVLREANWFRIPYPFQWGLPTISFASTVGMMAAVISSMLESLGDYNALTRIIGLNPVPPHAMNRGIFVEGLCNILTGMFGSGTGSTSYGENISAIGITKVASRRVIQLQSLFCLILGTVNKFGALTVIIPDPIIGGLYILVFGMIVAIGVSNLQAVDMNSSRNLSIFGFSILLGLALPHWIQNNPERINIGNKSVEQMLTVLLGTGMLVGAFTALILDNTVRGTPEERGLSIKREDHGTLNSIAAVTSESKVLLKRTESTEPVGNDVTMPADVIISPLDNDLKLAPIRSENEIYDLPYAMGFIRRHKIFSFLPISPTFRGYNFKRMRKSKKSEFNEGAL